MQYAQLESCGYFILINNHTGYIRLCRFNFCRIVIIQSVIKIVSLSHIGSIMSRGVQKIEKEIHNKI